MSIKTGRYNITEKKCPVCGTVFHPLYNRTNSIYCTLECYFKARWKESHRIIRYCKLCGQAFETWQSSNKKFCSKLCQYKWRSQHFNMEGSPLWKGGAYPYYKGPNWDIQRDRARRRAKYRCQHCGITETELGQEIDVDHIKPYQCFNSYKKANALSNLIALCRSCHSKFEHTKPRLPRFIPLT